MSELEEIAYTVDAIENKANTIVQSDISLVDGQPVIGFVAEDSAAFLKRTDDDETPYAYALADVEVTSQSEFDDLDFQEERQLGIAVDAIEGYLVGLTA